MAHPFIVYLTQLPQFQSQLIHSCAIDMRTGAHVSKYEGGGDEPKHRNTLQIWWPGIPVGEYVLVDGEKYVRLATDEAILLTKNPAYSGGLATVLGI